MGSYADNLLKRLQDRADARKPKPRDPNAEQLVSVAIVRGGETHARCRSHYELRASIDPSDPDPRNPRDGDIDGFMTSAGRFVSRRDAVRIAIDAGQIAPAWAEAARPLLSSDINW